MLKIVQVTEACARPIGAQTSALKPKYCRHCVRWYGLGFNQCNVPACGRSPETAEANAIGGVCGSKQDDAGWAFLRARSKYIHFASWSQIYGRPTELNRLNDCHFHLSLPRGLRWLSGLGRFFYLLWSLR
jgi:hypothetical protein